MSENPFKKIIIGTALAGTLASCNPDSGTTEMKSKEGDSKREMIQNDSLLDEPLIEVVNRARAQVNYSEAAPTILSPDSLIAEQKDWLMKYIQSPQYRNRLMIELVRQHADWTEHQLQDEASRIINNRMRRAQETPITIGGYGDDGLYSPLRNETRETMNGNDVVLEIKPVNHGKVFLGSNFNATYPNQVVHELSHASTDTRGYGDGIIDSTDRFIRDRVSTGIEGDFRKNKDSGIEYGYDNAPTEVLAALDVLRYLLAQEGIYDAGSEVFGRVHFEQLIKNIKIIDDPDVHRLLKLVKTPQDLIELMNGVA